MSDIVKCGDKACPKNGSCWRYQAPTDPVAQTWGTFYWATASHADVKAGTARVGCEHYWPMTPRERRGKEGA